MKRNFRWLTPKWPISWLIDLKGAALISWLLSMGTITGICTVFVFCITLPLHNVKMLRYGLFFLHRSLFWSHVWYKFCYIVMWRSGEISSVCSTGNEAPTSRSLISEFIRPLQISGDKPELLSVKPTFLTRGRVSSPARASHSEVSDSVRVWPIWLLLYCTFLHFHFAWHL